MLTNFLIISGTSGSGKTVALQVLEDLGFYCIDNLPASLLPEMAARIGAADSDTHKCAVSIDSRNQDFLGNLQGHFESLHSLNIDYRVIFIDADDKTLLKRYSQTRRRHPLADANTSLSEAIAKERLLLQPLSNLAHRRLDTTNTTPHELRSQIRDFAATREESSLTLLFQSFGFKYGTPVDADFVFDVRCLPNPYWNEALRPLTGKDAEVIEFLTAQPECQQMLDHIRTFLEYWLPCFIADNRNYITVAIGCTGGQHRSVFLSESLSKHFAEHGLGDPHVILTQIRHRELRH
ncbi:MAG: RNase adapter RapZ [Gammaproteobacteria bacterium]|nr:RNase adapter RapZ [Gammaproteobacteria bacterium]